MSHNHPQYFYGEDMAEIENEIKIVFYAKDLKLSTSLEKSTISIEDIELSDSQAASLGYMINNNRNLLEAEIKLTGKLPL